MPYTLIIYGATCNGAISTAMPEVRKRFGESLTEEDVFRAIGPRKLLYEREKVSRLTQALAGDTNTIALALAREIPRLYEEAIKKG